MWWFKLRWSGRAFRDDIVRAIALTQRTLYGAFLSWARLVLLRLVLPTLIKVRSGAQEVQCSNGHVIRRLRSLRGIETFDCFVTGGLPIVWIRGQQ